jgi:hypothetical protein
MWVPLPILHITNLEPFEFPSLHVSLYLGISILSNIAFTASFLTMVSLTSPVLSSVGAMYLPGRGIANWQVDNIYYCRGGLDYGQGFWGDDFGRGSIDYYGLWHA